MGRRVGDSLTRRFRRGELPSRRMSVAIHPQGEDIILSTSTHRLSVSVRGGRFLEYAIHGRNVLSTGGDWVQRGSTFWLGPHHAWPRIWPPDEAIDDEPYEVSIDARGVTMISPIVASFAARIRKRVEMQADGSLSMTYGVTAIDRSIQWSPWEVTRLRPGLCFFGTGRETAPIVDPVVAPIEPIVDGTVTWVPFEPGNDRFRTLLSDAAGWSGYAHDGLLLLKQFEPVDAAEFPPANGSLKIWWQNSDFMELEQLGPYRTIEAGEEIHYRTAWSLAELESDVEIAPRSASLRRRLPR